MDYPLCNQTVTVYHFEKGEVERRVEENCYFTVEQVERSTLRGRQLERRFLLVIPNPRGAFFPGDRIVQGEGPEITPQQWPAFVPAAVDGLVEAEYVAPYYFMGELCHIQVGRRAGLRL